MALTNERWRTRRLDGFAEEFGIVSRIVSRIVSLLAVGLDWW
ncbi:MAG: hypothetical protein ACK5AK_11035 [Gemmatimonas sp.]|jgi:hypothetical protein